MSVKHSIDDESKTLTIVINGKFDFTVHNGFRASYQNANPSLNVKIDLKNAEYMDSAALGMLLLLDEHFADKKIKIINAGQYVKEVLEVAQFHKRFDIS